MRFRWITVILLVGCLLVSGGRVPIRETSFLFHLHHTYVFRMWGHLPENASMIHTLRHFYAKVGDVIRKELLYKDDTHWIPHSATRSPRVRRLRSCWLTMAQQYAVTPKLRSNPYVSSAPRNRSNSGLLRPVLQWQGSYPEFRSISCQRRDSWGPASGAKLERAYSGPDVSINFCVLQFSAKIQWDLS